MAAALRPLKLPGFPRLSGAYLVNELGNWLGEIALAVLVFDLTGSPLAIAALFVCTQFLPALSTPSLTSLLERLPGRSALAGLYLGEAAVFAALAALASDASFALWGVLLLAALDGSIAGTARALTRATAAAVLAPSNQLREGNALLNVGFTSGAAAGPALAGLVIAGAGAQAALLVDAVSFVAVGVMLATARRLPSGATADTGAVIERVRRGLAYVRERRPLLRLMQAQAAAFVFFALVIPVEVAFAKDTLGAGDLGYGLLLAAWGAGMVAGSVLFAWLRRVRLLALLGASTMAIGIAYLGTAVSPTLAVACGFAAVGGTGNGVQWVALVTAVQEITESAFQARVLALLESLASAMPGIGFVAGGAVAALLSPRASYAVAGAGVFAVMAVAALSLRGARRLRGVDAAQSAVASAAPEEVGETSSPL